MLNQNRNSNKLKKKLDFVKLGKEYNTKRDLFIIDDIKNRKSSVILNNLNKRLNKNNKIVENNNNEKDYLRSQYNLLNSSLSNKMIYIEVTKLIVTYLLILYLNDMIGKRYNLNKLSRMIFISATIFFIGFIYIKYYVSKRLA